MIFVSRSNLTNKINGAWPIEQYAGQEQIDETHADYLEFMMIPKVSQIRAMRNQKLNDIDTKFCNAQKWSAMTPAEKDSWVAIKSALVAITDKDANGNYVSLTNLTVDGYLDNSRTDVWPW